jgi:perosamine synthetase
VRLLLAVAACHEAFLAAPLLRAASAAGHEALVSWLGPLHRRSDAEAMGLPRQPFTTLDAATTEPAGQAAAAMALAATLPAARFDAVLIVGAAPAAIAFADGARLQGLPVLRLAAGERTGDAADGDRRRADHAATGWLCTDEDARDQLSREGLPAARVHVVGSLAAAALAARPAAPRTATLWLAFEHAAARETAGRILFAAAATAAAASHLEARPAPDAPKPDALSQLENAQSAAVILTDSAGWLEFARALGTPAVLLPTDRSAAPFAPPGAIVADGIEDLGTAVAAAIARGRAAPLPADAAERVIAAIPSLLSSGDGQQPTGLPSDGDHSGRTFGRAEAANVQRVLDRGTLNSTRGTFVTTFERAFASWLGRKHVVACASGSAAVHAALAALALDAGDEVVTTPITDMGAITPILYEGAVPVFADVDATTLNVTPETVARALSPRTRAVVVTHLFGRPADVAGIRAVTEPRGIVLVDDAAQAFGATIAGAKVGTHGELAAFSLQQGKHITTGEGGLVATDDDELARRVFLFVNKAWGYGDPDPDHYFPALNYRLGELAGAVALGQLPKLDEVVRRRRLAAERLQRALAGIDGLTLPHDPEGGSHSYWKFALLVDPTVVRGGAVALGARLKAQGIQSVPRYIQKPAFECRLFRDWRQSPLTRRSYEARASARGGGPLFDRAEFPGAVAALERVVVLPINERYTAGDCERIAAAIRGAVGELRA